MPKYSNHWFARLLCTPLTDLVRGSLTGRLDVRRRIAATELPPPLCGLVYTVVRAMRAPALEQEEIAAELAARFDASLSAGESIDQIIMNFGDIDEAIRALRRSRQRGRTWTCRLRRSLKFSSSVALALLLAVYGFLLVRYFVSEPTIARDYLAEINATSQTIPETSRAWPVYREAILQLRPRPLELATRRNVAQEQWPELVNYLERHRGALDLARQASQRGRLGFFYGDPANAAWFQEVLGRDDAFSDHRIGLYALNIAQVEHLALLARLLAFDARRAALEQDGQMFFLDIRAALAMAGHLRDMAPTLSSELHALTIYELTLEELSGALYDEPDLISRDQLFQLAEAIRRHADGGSLHVNYLGERMAFHDFIQRIYTDDGSGEGHLTASSIETARQLSRGSFISLIGDQRLWPSGFSELVRDTSLVTLTADRGELTEMADRLWDQAEQEQQPPLWQWQASSAQEEVERLADSSMTMRIRYWPLLLFFPPVESINLRGEFVAQKRDAALTAVAMALYHKQNGAWPETLDQLDRELLPKLPVDRFTGGTLKYRLIGDRPLLYSVALDGNDDQGRPHRMGNQYGQRWEPRAKVVSPHIPPRGAPGRQRALGPKFDWDWVLWPPI